MFLEFEVPVRMKAVYFSKRDLPFDTIASFLRKAFLGPARCVLTYAC